MHVTCFRASAFPTATVPVGKQLWHRPFGSRTIASKPGGTRTTGLFQSTCVDSSLHFDGAHTESLHPNGRLCRRIVGLICPFLPPPVFVEYPIRKIDGRGGGDRIHHPALLSYCIHSDLTSGMGTVGNKFADSFSTAARCESSTR